MRKRIRHVASDDLINETPYAIKPPNLLTPISFLLPLETMNDSRPRERARTNVPTQPRPDLVSFIPQRVVQGDRSAEARLTDADEQSTYDDFPKGMHSSLRGGGDTPAKGTEAEGFIRRDNTAEDVAGNIEDLRCPHISFDP